MNYLSHTSGAAQLVTRLAVTVLFATIGIGLAHAQNLVTNGGFEVVNPPLGTYMGDFEYLTNSTLPGWSVIDDGIGEPSYVFDGATGFEIGDGLNSVSMNQGSSIFQSISLVDGETYEFSMLMSEANYKDYPTYTMDISIDGAQQSFSRPYMPVGFATESFFFTSDLTGLATLQIANNAPVGDFRNYVIDDVKVQAVPEPGSFLAFGMGLVEVARRRKQSRSQKRPSRNANFPKGQN